MDYDQEQEPVKVHKVNGVLQRAEKYAERFINEHDRARFMSTVQERLVQSPGRAIKFERAAKQKQQRDVE